MTCDKFVVFYNLIHHNFTTEGPGLDTWLPLFTGEIANHQWDPQLIVWFKLIICQFFPNIFLVTVSVSLGDWLVGQVKCKQSELIVYIIIISQSPLNLPGPPPDTRGGAVTGFDCSWQKKGQLDGLITVQSDEAQWGKQLVILLAIEM